MKDAAPCILSDSAHLWRISLAVEEARLAELAALLAPAERERAGALRFPRLRDRFVVGRGLLRETLARYTGAAPGAVELVAGAHGKPALAGEPAGGLRFSLSHSGDLMLIAVARGHDVGVDVERVGPVLGAGQIAASLFGAEERDALWRCPPEGRERLFAEIWTRREAVAKGEGGGLGSVPAAPREWSIFTLNPAESWVAALALEGTGWQATATPSDGEGAPWAQFHRASKLTTQRPIRR